MKDPLPSLFSFTFWRKITPSPESVVVGKRLLVEFDAMSHHTPGLVTSEQLCQLKAIVESWNLDEQGQRFCDELCLKRYIYSYGFSVEKAAMFLKETVEWRSSTQPAMLSLRDPDIASFAKAGLANVHGVDRRGHPIIWIDLGNDKIPCPSTELKMKKFKFILYIMERAISAMASGVDQWCIVIDLHNTIGVSKDDIMFGRQYLVKPLNDFYAERLSSCVLINVPVLFSAIWNLCKPFMDKTTIQKYRLIKRGSPQQLSVLTEIIDPSQIPCSLGGKDSFVFDFEAALSSEKVPTTVPVGFEHHEFTCSAEAHEATSSSPLELEAEQTGDVFSET